MRPRPNQWILGIAMTVWVGAAALVLLSLLSAVLFVRPTYSGASVPNSVEVGGLHYDVRNAWVLHPARPVDAELSVGLPRDFRRLRDGELLYAVFLRVRNDTGSPKPMAADIELRDTRNLNYPSLPVAAQNRFAYEPAWVKAESHVPAPGTAAQSDLATDGLMLVFRISRGSYDGPLQLVLHDPRHPDIVATVET